jgi:hypothetical protein
MMEHVNKENVSRSHNLPPVKAPSKRGSFGRLMSALNDDDDEKMVRLCRTDVTAPFISLTRAL